MSNIILCADDSKIMQTVAEITFRVSDYQYVGALSADEALDKARAQKPALILADAAMPDTDGYELCRAIKSDPVLADVPVIMMCGNSSAYDAGRGSEVRVDGHLNKPWDTQVLLDKVAEILQGAGGAKAATGRAAAKPAAAQAARPAVVPQPPILPASAPAQAAAASAAGRTATMIGMPQIPLEADKPKAGADRRAGMPEIDNPQPLAAPLPPKAAPAAAAARPATAPAAKPPGAAIARVATAPAAAAAGKAAGRSTTVGTPSSPAATPTPAPAPTPAARAATPAPTPAATPAAARERTPAPAPAAAPSPAPAPAAKPAAAAAPAAPARPAAAPAAPAPARAVATEDSGALIGRPPMIKGTPARAATGRAALAAQVQAAVPRAAAAVAREAGLDPSGPEMRALLALSKDVVERIVWEVVPDLAEAIIRENLEQLAAKR